MSVPDAHRRNGFSGWSYEHGSWALWRLGEPRDSTGKDGKRGYSLGGVMTPPVLMDVLEDN
jgi:hypothetical protein